MAKKIKKNIYELLNDANIPILNPNNGIKYLKGKPIQGGKRKNAGRKSISLLDKKVAVTIYVKQSIVDFYTMDVLREMLIEHANS